MTHLIAFTKEELSDLLKQVVSQVLNENMIQINHIEHKPIMTIDETCAFLKINRTTLNDWAKQGKIAQYGIGSRVYYKTEDILQKALIRTN